MAFSKLTWGVKASFRNYVEAAEGTIEVSDGASRTEEGTFAFEAIPGADLDISADGATGSMHFKGAVTFEAHGGMLKSTLKGLAVEASDEGLVISVVDMPVGQDRCAIATLEVIESGEQITFSSQITMDGMYQIADNYPPGTELDPVLLS